MSAFKTGTSSFIVTIKVRPNKKTESKIETMFEYGNKILNKCFEYVETQIKSMRKDNAYAEALKAWQTSSGSSKVDAYNELLAIIKTYKIGRFDVEAIEAGYRKPYVEFIYSDVGQKLAARAAKSASDMLFHPDREMHFSAWYTFRSMEGKKNTGISVNAVTRTLNITGMNPIPLRIRKGDTFVEEALTHRIKYCRLIRRPSNTKWKYYVQIVLEGTPPRKTNKHGGIRHNIGHGEIGIDPGVSTVAATNNKECKFLELAPDVDKYNAEVEKCSSVYSRKQRINNPQNYDKDGKITQGKHEWKNTKNMIRDRFQKMNASRRKSVYVKESHEKQIYEILELGDSVRIEKVNYKQWQQTNQKNLKLGRSVEYRAPGLFKELLKQRVNVIDINTQKVKASQYHHDTQEFIPKKISERTTSINGKTIQRDLYSAFVILNTTDAYDAPDPIKCKIHFNSFLNGHNILVKELLATPQSKTITQNFGLECFAC